MRLMYWSAFPVVMGVNVYSFPELGSGTNFCNRLPEIGLKSAVGTVPVEKSAGAGIRTLLLFFTSYTLPYNIPAGQAAPPAGQGELASPTIEKGDDLQFFAGV